MPRNGSGTYSAPASTWNPGVNGVTATTADYNAQLDDIEAAMTQSVSSDGQTPYTGNQPMGNNKLTGLGLGTANTDSASMANLFALAGQAGGSGDRNLLVNGNFAVNQRIYVTGTATTGANQVTLDRWRVATSGQSITFAAAAPDRVVTCPAGGLDQIIEAGWVVGGVYTLSWTGTATATVNGVAIVSGAQTAVLPANTAVTVKFSSGTVDRAQFELGTAATPYQRRPPGTEFMLCQREFQKSYATATAFATNTGVGASMGSPAIGGVIQTNVRFANPFRIPPTQFNAWTPNGTINQWVGYTAGGVATAYTAVLGSACETSATIALTVSGGEVWATGHWLLATGF